MSASEIHDIICIDDGSDLPKYLQISYGVIRAIERRKLRKGDALPSLRHLSADLNISFDTAKKAYDVLKRKNIVVAAHGKSNVVNVSGPLPAYRIFLLFNKLGSHKRIIYDAFTQSFNNATVDLFVYNNNLHLFRHLLATRKPGYTHFVIIPHLADDAQEIGRIIDEYLHDENLVILDKRMRAIKTPHATVHEDFENDIYTALKNALPSLKKYESLNLLFPAESYYPPEIKTGFEKFANEFGFEANCIFGIRKDVDLKEKNVYIAVADEDLAAVIQSAQRSGMHIGQSVGIISYNETPLKEVLLNGITTISTDFVSMGELAAEQVMSNLHEQISVPFRLTLRASL
jgi:hypothetical protein